MVDFSRLEDLKAFLQEKLILRVALDDLKNATPEIVQKIYVGFLHAFKYRVENLSQIPFHASLTEQELHQDIMSPVIIALLMDRLFKNTGSTLNFRLIDVLSPPPQGFKKRLVHLCQFYLHWESRMRLLRPIEDVYQKRKDEEELLMQGCEDMKGRINQLQHSIAEGEGRLSHMSDVQDRYEVALERSDKYKRDRDTLKREVLELAARLKEVRLEREQLPEAIEYHKSQIRPSIIELQKCVEEVEAEAKKAEEIYREMREAQERLDEKVLLELCSKLELIVETDKENKAVATQVLEQNEHLQSAKESIARCNAAILAVEKNNASLKEVLDILNNKNKGQLSKWQIQIEDKNIKLEERKKGPVEGCNAELRQLMEQEHSLMQAINDFNNTYSAIEKEFLTSFTRLRDTMKRDRAQEMDVLKRMLHELKKLR